MAQEAALITLGRTPLWETLFIWHLSLQICKRPYKTKQKKKSFDSSWPKITISYAIERDFPMNLLPDIFLFTLKPEKNPLINFNVNDWFLLATDFLLLWTLTLVLAVAVSVLMRRLTIRARPVTWCLLARQEDVQKGRKRMLRKVHVNKTVRSLKKGMLTKTLMHKHSCLIALYIVKKKP